LKDWLPSIAKALDFVHAQGYLHRDVKPPNILFDPYGNAFLSDFGITKFAVARQAAGSGKSLTGAGMVVGTPEYMAPEVILGQLVDGRLDQYGLAVTVYEVLAGRRPFEDATATAVLVQHTAQQPPDVRSFNGDVSPALAAVISQALAKEPAKRFANCVAFADAAIAAVSARSSAQSERPKLKCPACSKTLKIESKLQGKTVPCPACRAPLKVSDDLREVTLAGEEGQADRMRGGTRAVVAGDLLKRAPQQAPGEIPVEMPKQPTSHPDDFWEMDGELPRPVGSLPTQSFAAAEIRTQSSHMAPRKRSSAQSKPTSRAKAPLANRTKMLVASAAAAVLCFLGLTIYLVTGRENKTAILPDSAQTSNLPAPRFPQSQREHPQAQNNRTTPVNSPPAVVASPPQPSSPPSPAIYDITVSPATARLSVENPAVEITGSESQRRLRVSDPQAIPSLTVTLAADGYESLHRELTPRPGLNISFNLALNRSQPKVVDRPADIELRPKPHDLSRGAGAPRTEAPDAFDGDRPGKVREDNVLKTMLVWIPQGHFTMGTPVEQGSRQNEGPVAVTLTRGFWLGKYEVTQSEWQSVMHTAPWHGHLYVEEGENDAASYINWDDATVFCTELTKQEHAAGRLPAHWNYALPTEAQWEYACRAGTTTPFNFGKALSQLLENGWFAQNASSRREEHAHRVGGLNENQWGLHDVHGNVSEWCRDLYTATLPGGTDPEVVVSGSQRVLRGGGWRSNFDDCRSASRNRAEPAARSPAWGLRIAAVNRTVLQLALKSGPEVPKTSEAVNELVLQSHEMIKSLNFSGAHKTLEKASSIDQTSIVADCTLGLLYSISSPDQRSPKLAEKYFRIALRRRPGDVATLNNLALADIRLRKYADAVRCLKEASKKSPDAEEVLQNLGRFLSQARSGRIRMPASVLSEATGIHNKLAAARPGGQANRGTGWLYIPIEGQPTLPLGGADIYEDHCCIVCNGRGRVRCPHCSGGSVSDDVVQSGVARTPFGNLPYADTISVQRRCTVCGGTGHVHCPHCANGYDRGGR
jgi:sulfatase modifying factor 1